MISGFFRLLCLISALLTVSPAAIAGTNIYISPEGVYQGRTFSVTLRGEGIISAKTSFLGREIPLYLSGEQLSAMIGVPAGAPEGNYQLTVTSETCGGEKIEHTAQLEIWPYSFLEEKLLFPPQKSAKLTSEKIAADQQELARVFNIWTPDRLWEGMFIIPVKGRITSPFGAYRLYNGKRLGDHRGVDIGSNPAGTPIKASNNGIVAFAKPLPAYGSTVVIDHGQGIHSVYMHLSKTLVTAGQYLKKGDVIGRVGSTGISTGPHLHWGISVHDTRVDPLAWSDRTAAD